MGELVVRGQVTFGEGWIRQPLPSKVRDFLFCVSFIFLYHFFSFFDVLCLYPSLFFSSFNYLFPFLVGDFLCYPLLLFFIVLPFPIHLVFFCCFYYFIICMLMENERKTWWYELFHCGNKKVFIFLKLLFLIRCIYRTIDVWYRW